MKKNLILSAIAVILLSSFTLQKQSEDSKETNNLKQGDYVVISGPNLLEPNSMVKVSVEYKTSSNRDITVFLQSTSNWEQPLAKTTPVSAGSGTIVVEFKVPRLPDSNKGYRWGSYVSTSGGGFGGKISEEAFVNEVSVKRVKKIKEKKED